MKNFNIITKRIYIYIYISIAERYPAFDHKSRKPIIDINNIKRCSYIVVDLDCRRDIEWDHKKAENVYNTLKTFNVFDDVLCPHIILNSGRGLHLFLFNRNRKFL